MKNCFNESFLSSISLAKEGTLRQLNKLSLFPPVDEVGKRLKDNLKRKSMLEKTKKTALQAIIVFIVSFLFIAVPIVCFNDIYFYCSDESLFLQQGRDSFHVIFVERDSNRDFWMDEYSRRNPRLALYIFGGLDVLAKNIHNIFHDVETLIILKLLLSAIAAGCTAAFYLLLKTTLSQRAGIIASVFFLVNPFFKLIRSAVLLELLMLFFILWALLAIAFMEIKLKKGVPPWKTLSVFGVLAGLAISCKLYAFPLYPTFLFVLFSQRTRFKCNDSVKMLSWVLFLSIGVFIISNPILYHNFFTGMKDMTTGHLANKSGSVGLWNFSGAKYILIYPFILYRRMNFNMNREVMLLYLYATDFITVFVGYVLLIGGLLRQRFKKIF